MKEFKEYTVEFLESQPHTGVFVEGYYELKYETDGVGYFVSRRKPEHGETHRIYVGQWSEKVKWVLIDRYGRIDSLL